MKTGVQRKKNVMAVVTRKGPFEMGGGGSRVCSAERTFREG